MQQGYGGNASYKQQFRDTILWIKVVFTTLFVLLTGGAFAQSQRIDSIPKDGILLDTGWLFRAGDNPEWSKPDLSNAEWQPVLLSNQNFLPKLENKNLGWFAKTLLINSALLKTGITFQLAQLGASEVYVNGNKLQQSGEVNTGLNSKSFNPGNKPFILPQNTSPNVVIAIRFASKLPAKAWLYTGAGIKRPPLTVTINSWDHGLDTYKTAIEESKLPAVFYIFIVLALLFLLLFTFFRKERINLLFGAFCLFQATSAVLEVYLSHGNLDISEFSSLSFILDLNSIILGTSMLLIISHTVLNRLPGYLLLIIGGMALDMLIFFFFGYAIAGVVFDFLCRLSVMTVFFYLSIKAFGKRNYIIGIVSANSGIINILGILTAYSTLNLNPSNLISLFIINFILITFYVSLNFARKSKNLEVQLMEISNLSRENLKKEQEKQQLLASQNETLEKQVTERTAELNASLNKLRATQSQLIQSEKMASLGELTAGIAHEIQNPLNFVNNFSEINQELLGELNDAADKRDFDEVKAIAHSISDNEAKINQHGKRADGIVKGMLQHSRQTKGVKTPTDLNALCDEYLRLSYQGLRAKDKDFNADFTTDFDKTLDKVNVVPGDMGRALLNLCNNAFYAVNEKKKGTTDQYRPTVSIQTKKLSDGAEIKVSDNGNGIPLNIIDKIFQPFFTTKPPGLGTGLGLSLSYDIIKAQGGEIKAETKEGEGSVFIILLPEQ